jgi:hypothetical protein
LNRIRAGGSESSRLEILRERESLTFGAVAILGALSILWLHSLGAPQVIVTGAPVVLMLSYAALEYFIEEAPTDELGDRLYYLGFLLTLTSLGYSLWRFEGSANDVALILSNFGVALTTTILGLVLRVVLSQIHEDPVGLERTARMELREAARDLRIELISCVEDIETFRRTVLLSISDGLKEMVTSFSSSMQDATKAIASAAQERLKTFGDSADQAVIKIDNALLVLPSRASEIGLAANKIVAALDDCCRRIQNVTIDSDMLADKFKPLGDSLTDYEAATAELVKTQRDAARKLRKSFDTLADGITATASVIADTTALSAMRSKTEEVASSLTHFRETLNSMTEGVLTAWSKSSESLLDIGKSAEANLDMAAANRKALELEVEKSRAVFGEVQEALLSSARLIVERLGNGAT